MLLASSMRPGQPGAGGRLTTRDVRDPVDDRGRCTAPLGDGTLLAR